MGEIKLSHQQRAYKKKRRVSLYLRHFAIKKEYYGRVSSKNDKNRSNVQIRTVAKGRDWEECWRVGEKYIENAGLACKNDSGI